LSGDTGLVLMKIIRYFRLGHSQFFYALAPLLRRSDSYRSLRLDLKIPHPL